MSTHKSDHAEDLAFVRQIVDGDDSAAEEFVNRFSQRFHYIAFKRGVVPNDCQDVVQDATMTALEQMRRGMYRGDASLGNWLLKILCGKIIDYFRRQKRWRIDKTDDLGLELQSDRFPDLRNKDIELDIEMREVMERLPREMLLILLLKRNEGCTIEEIARMLDLTEGQVSGKLYRAQAMFCKYLVETSIKKKGERRKVRGLIPSTESEA